MKRIKIGNNHRDYGAVKNFLSLPFKQVVFKKTFDAFTISRYILFRYFKISKPFFQFFHFDLGLNGVPLLHFFNSISFSNKPWIVTFETAIPRWNTSSAFGMKLLAKNNCKKIIAMSQCAYDIQLYYLNKFPEHNAKVVSKMCVIHPAQALKINNYEEKILEGKFIVFSIVGADFFRKGGKEILLTFEKLLQNGFPVRLNIVSSFQYGDYASQTTFEDLVLAKNIISNFSNNIFYFESLSNEDVLLLFNKTHIGLLPTFGDSYGYSLLEAQASGCPVISTDLRALPEINNNEVGWLIEVPKNELRNGKLSTPEERKLFSAIVQNELYKIITHICENKSIIKIKGERAIERIRLFHNPIDRVLALEKIYQEALI